jgi:hypothetical protein
MEQVELLEVLPEVHHARRMELLEEDLKKVVLNNILIFIYSLNK